MKNYLRGIDLIKDHGYVVPPARTGMPSRTVYDSLQLRFTFNRGFPIITTKKMAWKQIVTELFWFLQGGTNIKYLIDNNCHIWDDNAYQWYRYHNQHEPNLMSKEDFIEAIAHCNPDDLLDKPLLDYQIGDLGMVYGHFWRNAFNTDQFQDLIDNIRENPFSNYHNVTAWKPNLTDHENSCQPNCHIYYQVTVRRLSHPNRRALLMKYLDTKTLTTISNKKLNEMLDTYNIPKYGISLNVLQRSADYFLGVPFNISSYALLTYIIAYLTNTIPINFVWNGMNTHIYSNHTQQVDEQFKREPMKLPKLGIKTDNGIKDFELFMLHDENKTRDIDEFLNRFSPEQFVLINYQSHPAIKGELSVGTLV